MDSIPTGSDSPPATLPSIPPTASGATTASGTLVAKPKPQPRPLVGDELRRPAWLWLTHVVPTVLAFLSGAYTYSIIAGDMSAGEKQATLAQAIVLVAVALLSATLALAKQRRSALLSNADYAGLLAMSVSVVATGIIFTFFTIPFSLPEWIAGREELLCRFACLGMIGAFYSILVLSAYPLRSHGGIEFLKAVGVIAACAGALFIYLQIQIATHFSFPQWLIWTVLWVSLFVGATLITAAVTRLTLIAYTAVRRMRPYLQQALMFVIAVAGPLAGLWLNRTIPFPSDFQAPIVYLLAVVNGGILMLPVVRSIGWHRVIWLAQCVMFPFSAYFLIVFLPWMPLSVFAMIAIGSGFLMLAPVVLGIAHGYRVVDGYREEVRDGVWWKPALAGLAAVLVLPAALGWNMWQDRRTLDQALDYVYAPDYRTDVTFPGDLGRLRNSLQHLRDMKHGIFLPFISPAYNAVVFHGLVLPDARIEYLQHAFFGGAQTAKSAPNLMMRSNSAFAQDSSGSWRAPGPPTGGVMKDVQVVAHPEQGFTVSHLTLEMTNPGSAQTEFVTTIQLPEGVYVSNFGLVINHELVPARIVEKKTAMWVFEKITAVRRDPGLLIYKNRTELELRIFPFAAGETRRAEIELIHPNASRLPIMIGDKTVELNPDAPTDLTALATCVTPSGSVAIADGKALAALGVNRKPYLDVLIDCSSGSSYSASELAQALDKARAAFPDARLARVTAVNYEARDIVSGLKPVAQLDPAEIQRQLLPLRGGFLEDRFLKRGLLQACDTMQKDEATALLRPQFVVISSAGQPGMRDSGLESFLRLVPDARIVYTEKPAGQAGLQDMTNLTTTIPDAKPDAILLWQWSGHYAATPAGGRALATFPGNTTGQPLVYDAATGKFTAPATAIGIAGNSRFGDGVRTWAAQDEAALDPALLQNGAAALIGLSKQTRILIPDSSFIAVETSSQWRAMEEKEKQKLANKQVFEIEEPVSTPEPSTWILLLAGIALLALNQRRLRLKAPDRETPAG